MEKNVKKKVAKEKNKSVRINVNLKIVRDTLEKMNSEKSKLGLDLLEEAVFMKSTLGKLKQRILLDGVVTDMCQGNYSIDRANPALAQYNTLIKNYQNCVKQILELLPEDFSHGDEDDDFDEFNK